jgi:hypothetical protein
MLYMYVYIVFLHSVLRLLVTDNVHSSLILVTLMMQAIGSFETSVLTRATQRSIPEDAILRERNIAMSNLDIRHECNP